jgi:hypothetical protein
VSSCIVKSRVGYFAYSLDDVVASTRALWLSNNNSDDLVGNYQLEIIYQRDITHIMTFLEIIYQGDITHIMTLLEIIYQGDITHIMTLLEILPIILTKMRVNQVK